MFRYRALAAVLSVFALTSCTERDRTGVIEPPREKAPGTGRIECTASVIHATLRCVAAAAPTGAPAGLRAAVAPAVMAVDEPVIVGKPYVGMEHEAASVAVGANTFSFNARVLNDSILALGTTDGTTPDAAGVRVFFHTGPQITDGGPGTVAVAGGGDGSAEFATTEPKIYYQYDDIVARGGTSDWRAWQFDFTEGVQTFVFTVYIAARVQYPQGWVDVDPAAFEIAKDATQQLTAVVRDVVGRAQVGADVTWSSSDEAVATVSGSGVVTGVSAGTATITAESPGAPAGVRTGSAVASVGTPPTAAADAYTGGRNTTLTVPAASGVLDNDDLGAPAAVLTHFGGGSLGGSVTDNAAGASAALPGETGTLTLYADGGFVFVPPTGQTGEYTFSYRIANMHGTSDALVTIDVPVYNVTVASSGSSSGGSWVGNTWTPSAIQSTVLASEVAARLGNGPTVITTAGAGSEGGDIVVDGAITWTTNTLTLHAGHDVTINGALTGSGTAALSIEYGQGETAAGNTGVYRINTFVTLNMNAPFSTTRGSDGVPDVRAMPPCGRGGCPFLQDSDLANVTTKYGTKDVQGTADTDTWIYLNARPALLGEDAFPGTDSYFPFAMGCTPGQGELRFPNGALQYTNPPPPSSSNNPDYPSGYTWDDDGTILNLGYLELWTTVIRACQPWVSASPVYTFQTSVAVANRGWYVKFRPNAGETGRSYQFLTVVFVDQPTANTVLWAVDYVIHIVP